VEAEPPVGAEAVGDPAEAADPAEVAEAAAGAAGAGGEEGTSWTDRRYAYLGRSAPRARAGVSSASSS
jgi:hypothetical protein